MKRRLYVISALTAFLFIAGAVIIHANINTIVDFFHVHNLKMDLQRRHYLSMDHLQESQKLLFKHQAGYASDINNLVEAIEGFDHDIAYIVASHELTRPKSCQACHLDLADRMDHFRKSLRKIQELTGTYKAKISIMLTSTDDIQRGKREKESSDLGGIIISLLQENIYAFDTMVDQTISLSHGIIRRAERTIIISTILILLGFIVTLATTVPFITKSINHLIDGTEALAAGDYTRKIPFKGRDEIGLLAERFNNMADRLRAREHQLRELNANLENLVAERTRELELSYQELRETAANLEKANIVLSELDRMKSDFISIASHELRTPLVTIHGYIDILLEGRVAGPLSPQQRDILAIAAKSSRRLTSIIKNILDISRIEQKKAVPYMKPVSLIKVVEDAMDDQKHHVDRRGQSLSFTYGDDLPLVLGDENMLMQVFINLINNAIKYTPNDGRINIAAHARRRREISPRAPIQLPKGDDFVEVVVADNGVGIPPEDQERVFDKFYEVGDIKSHSSGDYKFMGGGIGLGLSIVQGFVQEHRGIIWVESPGRDTNKCPGSQFHVVLPAIVNQATANGQEKPPVPASDTNESADALTASRAKSKLVLLIDDDPDIVRYMEVLMADKYKFESAYSGQTGLDKAQDLNPDIILLDILMQDMNGYEVTRLLKKNPSTRHIPIILFTAKTQKNELEEGLALGAADYIVKPFTQQELFDKMESILGVAS